MKITLNWLKQYVDFNWSPEELSERLTMIGIEVEGMKKLGGEFEGIVVAQILSSEKHPNADKLSVCRVADGRGERQIVCGAKNYQVGDKVPLILPGHTLPAKPGEEPFAIKVSKVRGVESHGMMCSARELGISEDAAGLLILPPDSKVGQSFAEHLGRPAGDVVYDLEITPNRPDLNSVIGIAREISAVTGNPLRLPALLAPATPATSVEESAGSRASPPDGVAVRLDEPELCPRYTARVVKGVRVGPSPGWLKNTLENVGVRSISNVVDVTNYVMLETGQPLHAFDYHLLAKGSDGQPTIVVRRAREGEKFATLDGQERTLTGDMLLIADQTRAIALAGIMGGQNSEINDQTVDVLIESACFAPQNVRATSKKLDLRTESSYRFERGADIGICDWAGRRAAQLILQTAGGALAKGVVDAYPRPVQSKQITLRQARVGRLLGVEIPAAQTTKFLRALNLEILAESPESCMVRIPSFRIDLKCEVDLIEEVARLHGVENIPATPPRGAIGTNSFDAVHDILAEARRILTGLGLHEAQGQTLISEASARRAAANCAALSNPLSSDMNVLRPSLVPGLLDALRHNVSRKNNDVTLFELGRVFIPDGGQIREERRLAIALTGQRGPGFWGGENREARIDVNDLKGLLDEFLDQFAVRGIQCARRSESTSLLLESAAIHLGRQVVGELGQLLPALAREGDLRDAVLLAEMNFDLLLARRSASKAFKPLPAFPAIRRDVAMLVTEETTHQAVVDLVKQAHPQNLEQIELFDVFRGRNVPAGQKSVAYAFIYRSNERTLTDSEVNATHEKLVEQLKRGLNAIVREK